MLVGLETEEEIDLGPKLQSNSGPHFSSVSHLTSQNTKYKDIQYMKETTKELNIFVII